MISMVKFQEIPQTICGFCFSLTVSSFTQWTLRVRPTGSECPEGWKLLQERGWALCKVVVCKERKKTKFISPYNLPRLVIQSWLLHSKDLACTKRATWGWVNGSLRGETASRVPRNWGGRKYLFLEGLLLFLIFLYRGKSKGSDDADILGWPKSSLRFPYHLT